MLATEVIKKKRNQDILSKEEIQFFISSYTQGEIPDYQMASLLMAIFLNGMSTEETIHLTQTMLDSGEKVNFEGLSPVDKHSTGGVGDKTSLILGPIVAACGIPVPMMSGRGLGHTGGTLDKLESIPGFNVRLDLNTFKKNTKSHGLCFIGQTEKICPADKKIYSLRDVTSTVESLPLICASIMSKKIAEGIKGLVLDVKFGTGAFMKTLDQAKELAKNLISIGQGHGIKAEALLTDMNQPLGSFIGNALEVEECLSILKREDLLGHSYKNFKDTEELSLQLSAKMIAIGKRISFDEAYKQALHVLDNGQAFEKFNEVCNHQGGDLDKLPRAKQRTEILSNSSGFISAMDCEKIGVAGIELGAGRKLVKDLINPKPGIEVLVKIGSKVEKNQPLYAIYHDQDKKGFDEAHSLLKSSYTISEQETSPISLIVDSF